MNVKTSCVQKSNQEEESVFFTLCRRACKRGDPLSIHKCVEILDLFILYGADGEQRDGVSIYLKCIVNLIHHCFIASLSLISKETLRSMFLSKDTLRSIFLSKILILKNNTRYF